MKKIIDIVLIIDVIILFIIGIFFDNFYNMAIWVLMSGTFLVISNIVCPECKSSSKKSSKMGTTEMPDKPINATE